ncbi:MAG: PAS domain S-box protein [Thermoflexibacter sp.]|jgi:PAS domain S-box-containing protein|nr:PAS domain S-box protein [Thermoflexibacter sp.]
MTRKKYIIGAVISILVLLFNQVFIQYQLNTKRQEAEVINLAGRQRMLSQKINLEFYKLINDDTNQDSIVKYYHLWEKVHYSLLNGNDTLNITSIKEKNARRILNSLTTHIQFIASNFTFLSSPNQIDIAQINKNQYHFLIHMDKVVKHLENEAEAKLHFIIFAEAILAFIAILVISMEVRYIYVPITRKLKSTIYQLSDSENRLRAVLDSALNGTVLISPNFKILAINTVAQKALYRFFQKEAKVKQDFWQYVTRGTEQKFEDNFRKALQGEVITFEEEIVFMNNKQMWISFSFAPAYDDKKQIIGVVFNTMNINERKKAEEALKKSERKLRAILDSTLNNNTLVGLDFKILSVNQKAKETIKLFFNKEAKEGDDFEQYIFEENVAEFKSDFQRAIMGESIRKEKVIRLRNTHQHIWYEFHRTPVYDEHGQLMGVAFNSIEIQKRKELEEALQLSESKLKAVLDSSPNSNLLISPDFKIIHVNRIAKDLTNEVLKQNIFEGADMRDFVPEVSKDGFYYYFQEALKGNSNIVEVKRTVNQLSICIQVQYFPVYHHKELLGVALNIIDFGKLRQTEDELVKTNEKLERTNTIAKIGTWELDLESKEVTWSKVTRAIYEVEEDKEINLDNGILFYKEGKDRDRITQAVHKAIQDGNAFDEEVKLVTAKRREIWVRVIGLTVFENGKCKRLYGTLQDIDTKKRTEIAIKEAEHRLELLTSNFPDGSVSLISKDLVVLYTAGMGYKDYHIKPKDIIGKPLSNILLSNEVYAKIEEASHHLSDGHSHSLEVEFELKTYQITLQPVFDEEGGMSSFVLVAMDITERKQNEESLKEKNIILEKIAWIQSHEVRRPVANILGLMNLINIENDEEEVKIYLQYLHQSTEELDQIIHKIVSYANVIY